MAVVTQPNFAPKMGEAPVMGQGISGLDYLASLDQLIIKQKVDLMEVLTGCEMSNKYDILNSMQQQAYYAFEESDTCNRLFCGTNRGFIFHIQDNYQQEVLTLDRPFKCCAGSTLLADVSCCQYPINVLDGQGRVLGVVRTTTFCCRPHFGIFDKEGHQLYEITGGMCRCQCAFLCQNDVEFPVVSLVDGSKVATVAKQWGGVIREMYTDADTFCVTFPKDMDVVHKALIFASVFLVDMVLYEQNQKKKQN